MTEGKRRRGSPQLLGSVLADALAEYGLSSRLGQRRALEAWPSIVGIHIARHARAIDLADGVLTLQADHGAWRQELLLLAPQIKARFDRQFGPGTVKEIRWARTRSDENRNR
jgi:predicted nucleic acid-binding Zn ribbon protein